MALFSIKIKYKIYEIYLLQDHTIKKGGLLQTKLDGQMYSGCTVHHIKTSSKQFMNWWVYGSAYFEAGNKRVHSLKQSIVIGALSDIDLCPNIGGSNTIIKWSKKYYRGHQPQIVVEQPGIDFWSAFYYTCNRTVNITFNWF